MSSPLKLFKLVRKLSGIIYKLIHATSFLIVEKLKDIKIIECLNILKSLFPSLKLWISLQSKLLASQQKETVWGADFTIFKSLPLLWAMLGEISREIAKQRIGITFSETYNDIFSILNIWKEFSMGSIGIIFNNKSWDSEVNLLIF